MSLSKFVKIGNISSLSDARYCAGMMVDILGFEIIDENSPHYVDPATFKELTEWVAGVSFAGECHDTDLPSILRTIENYQTQYLELNQLELLEKVSSSSEQLLIYRLKIDSKADLDQITTHIKNASKYAELIIIDSSYADLIKQVDTVMQSEQFNTPLLRAYELDMDTVQELPDFWHGIELKATVEDKAGDKDYGIVMDILEQIEID